MKEVVTVNESPTIGTVRPADVFANLSGIILHHYPRGRIIVAIDSAETDVAHGFADTLAQVMRADGRLAIRAGMADLVARLDEVGSPAGTRSASLHEPKINYDRVRGELLNGFRRGTFNVEDQALPIQSEAQDRSGTILIVDGQFLLRPELRDTWNYRVWLESDHQLPQAEFEARLLYVRDGAARESADATYDVTDPSHPARIWGDSC